MKVLIFINISMLNNKVIIVLMLNDPLKNIVIV